MSNSDNETIVIGSLFLTLATICASCHLLLLAAVILERRHSSSAISFVPQITSRHVNSRERPPKRNISSYFFVSFWFCFIFNIVTRLAHDGPSIFVGGHVFGSNAAGIFAWFARCLFYSSIFHSILIVVSGFCNRFDLDRSMARSRCGCLTSKLRTVLATLFVWLLSVVAATLIKYRVCEYQFDPRSYGYVCVYSIHYTKGLEKPSTQTSSRQTAILLFADGSIIGLTAVWLAYGNWAIRKVGSKRRRRVEQARTVLSVSDQSFATAPSAGRNSNANSSRSSTKVKMRSNRLIALSAIFIFRNICYLFNMALARNRWHHFAFTVIDFFYIALSPIVYILFTKSMRQAISCRGRRQNPRIAVGGESGDDDYSLFSFSQTAAASFSASTERISSTSLTRVAEKSPFTKNVPLDNNSPSMSSRDDSASAQFRSFAKSPNASSSRYLSAEAAQELADEKIFHADVHRQNVYALPSLKRNSDVSPRNGLVDKNLEHIFFDIPQQNGTTKRKRVRRPVRFLRQTPSVDQNDQQPSNNDRDSNSTGIAATDIDSTTSDLSLSLQHALAKNGGWMKHDRDSLENYETNGSVKERSVAARQFVEAYEAKNSRLHHSLAIGQNESRGQSIGLVGLVNNYAEAGLSAIDEGGISLKKILDNALMRDDCEIRTAEKRWHHQDG